VSRSIDRRSFLAGSAAAAAAGSLGAALDGPIAGASGNRQPNGVTNARPRRGGTLVVGVTAEEQGFNPTRAKFDSVGVMYARTVFDPLAIVLADGRWAPYLAQSIVPNTGHTSWKITLRPGVVFHDTTPCDGGALLMNLNAQLHSLLAGPALQPIVTNITRTGPLSVTITFNQAWVPFPFYLAGGAGSGQPAYVMAPAMINSKTGGTDNPIGTGPFRFKEWIPNTHFTATAWEKYWRRGLPHLAEITFKPIPNSSARAQALQSGTIDIMVTDDPGNIRTFRGHPGWAYTDDSRQVVGEPTMDCILLNLAKPPFDNPTVRLAAAKAFNRSSYVTVIDFKVEEISRGLFVPGSPFYSKTTYPAYDPSAARALVKQVKAQTGRPVSFTLGSTTSPAVTTAATFTRQQFADVGFDVTLKVFEQNELIDNALQGTFQAYLWRQFGAVDPDLNYIFWSTTTYSADNLSINMARNDDPAVEAALQVGRTSSDAGTRYRAYQKVNQLFAKDLPYLWQDRAVWAVVARPDVQNFANPTTPSGEKAYGMIGGSIFPTQIWIS
jgi:ABC-type transport system substrate-binding protein